ncbi:hypothetical protein HBO08_26890 [Pseudomonas rhodesiae]|uniref:hypothetical protein n=1 Tax=Pseudomonas rhodesiae TaxID=76760 RepID=UPI0014739473|nr:hypothetical protein [Pseudomonas rhodesiae]NMZ20615.1 hypothetical protein [Pseudomonas rhodesiae]
MIDAIAQRLGFIRVAVVRDQLQFARNISKRLDEHREVVEQIQSQTNLFTECPWHVSHMATQDDYLMRIYRMVHGAWPDHSDEVHRQHWYGEFIRQRPQLLGGCGLRAIDVQSTTAVADGLGSSIPGERVGTGA